MINYFFKDKKKKIFKVQGCSWKENIPLGSLTHVAEDLGKKQLELNISCFIKDNKK